VERGDRQRRLIVEAGAGTEREGDTGAAAASSDVDGDLSAYSTEEIVDELDDRLASGDLSERDRERLRTHLVEDADGTTETLDTRVGHLQQRVRIDYFDAEGVARGDQGGTGGARRGMTQGRSPPTSAMESVDVDVEVSSKATHDRVAFAIENYRTSAIGVRLTQPLSEGVSPSQVATLSKFAGDAWTVSESALEFDHEIDWGREIETAYAVKDVSLNPSPIRTAREGCFLGFAPGSVDRVAPPDR